METRVKYVLLEMRSGCRHPKVVFFFPDGQGGYLQPELILDTEALSIMFDEAVMGLMPDILTTAHGVNIQYNLDFAYRVVDISHR